MFLPSLFFQLFFIRSDVCCPCKAQMIFYFVRLSLGENFISIKNSFKALCQILFLTIINYLVLSCRFFLLNLLVLYFARFHYPDVFRNCSYKKNQFGYNISSAYKQNKTFEMFIIVV